MNAWDYLRRIRKIDLLIENKKAEIRRLKALADSTTADMSGERVQSTGNPHRLTDAIDSYIDIEAELRQAIPALEKERAEIIATIEQLPATDYDILHRRFVQGQDLCEVAVAYRMTYTGVSTRQGRAVRRVQKILDEREA